VIADRNLDALFADSVAPGLIDTDITGGALQGERKDALLAGIPVGRNGRVEDAADLITG
jgi:2-hydroxycyclohexanecarboxyl-CoA dehydrogenase